MIYTVTLNPSIDYIVQLETLELGQLNRIAQDYKFPGGKGINVSRILQRLGKKNAALGFLGGFTGDFIRSSLEQEGILTDFTTISDDTRINIKLKAQEETEVNCQGPTLSLAEIADLKSRLAAVSSQDIVILSGSIPPSLPRDFYSQLIELITAKGAHFVIDTTGSSLLETLEAQPLLVKPNHHELAELFATSFSSIEDILPYGQLLLEKGAQHVIVSLGGDGALLFSGDAVYQAAPLKGTLINSVGAGDSMIAGFVSQLSATPDLELAFRYGVACGSATAFSADLATAAAITDLLDQITLKKLK